MTPAFDPELATPLFFLYVSFCFIYTTLRV
jgi:hypothetical protein